MTKIIDCENDDCPYVIDLDIINNAWHEKLGKHLCDLCTEKDDG